MHRICSHPICCWWCTLTGTAGVQVGHRLLSVAGETTEGMTIAALGAALKAAPRPVELVFQVPGNVTELPLLLATPAYLPPVLLRVSAVFTAPVPPQRAPSNSAKRRSTIGFLVAGSRSLFKSLDASSRAVVAATQANLAATQKSLTAATRKSISAASSAASSTLLYYAWLWHGVVAPHTCFCGCTLCSQHCYQCKHGHNRCARSLSLAGVCVRECVSCSDTTVVHVCMSGVGQGSSEGLPGRDLMVHYLDTVAVIGTQNRTLMQR